MMSSLQFIPGLRHCGHLTRQSIAVATFAMALVAGCASTPEKSGAMVDENANFSDYETFGWYDDPIRNPDTQPLTLVESSIRDAIAAEMLRRGYREAPMGVPADLLISYQAASAEKVKSSPFTIGIGVGSYGSSGGASVGTSTSAVKNVTEGSLTIHAIDAARNSEVWVSDVTRELGEGMVSSEDVKAIVADVFTEFPARTPAQ